MIKIGLVLLLTLFANLVPAMETIVNKPQRPARGLVVIAPAKKYLMQERLFASLAERLAKQGYIAVRFNWSPDTLLNPALEQQRAARDIQYVTLNAQRVFGFNPQKTVLVSKSFSTKSIEPSVGLAKFHILLTPNCAIEAPFLKAYGNVLSKVSGRVRMIISDEDPYCQVSEIRQALANLGKPELLVTTKGDHNFVVLEPVTKKPSYQFQDAVVNYVEHVIQRVFQVP